jgi:Ni,Fe-hydrogenase III large subunit
MTVMWAERTVDARVLAKEVASRVETGAALAGLFVSPLDDGSTTLRAVLAEEADLAVIAAVIPSGTVSYPSLTPTLPAAAWYEREIRDLYGLEPVGHPYDDPLLLPRAQGTPPPRPGPGQRSALVEPDTDALPRLVGGDGVFTIPLGPVRSGVFESVEYLVETPGEDIPYLRTRVYHKHRGVESRFVGLHPSDGVLLAERVEGVASVSHAIAFCQTIETLAGVHAPEPAWLVRIVHAELERVVNHLDSIIRHTEGAAQAVAYARFGLHKERLMRLRAELCGHRFGRSVVVPGGVAAPTGSSPVDAAAKAASIASALSTDLRLLMATPSFIDRLRGTGVISTDVAASLGILGPVGRGSAEGRDVRRARPYGSYQSLTQGEPFRSSDGDALARQLVRIAEIEESFDIITAALGRLDSDGDWPTAQWVVPAVPDDGWSIGSVEAPQGELLYMVEVDAGRLSRVKVRSASFHNLAFFRRAFVGDIFTDFAFIEASFGLSIAGVSL